MTVSSQQTAIVTGAAQGVGLEAAKLLVERNYHVIVSDINAEAGEQAVAEINANFGRNAATFVACDVSSTYDLDKLFSFTIEKFSGFSVLVNNAGYLRAPFLVVSGKTVSDMIAINLTAALYASHRAIQYWGDHPDMRGTVVNIGSSSCVKGYASIAAYSAAKAGIAQFTFNCQTLGPRIRVNSVAPTAIATALGYSMLVPTPAGKSGPGWEIEPEMVAEYQHLLQPAQVAIAALECIDDEKRFGKVVYIDAKHGQKTWSGYCME